MKMSDAERLAIRRVANTLRIPAGDAGRLLLRRKTDDNNWGQAADAVILEHAGEGLPIETEGDAQ